MKKVAIVGVEGSGKTVMLAGLGDLYTYPDEDGYFLVPKNFGTAAYVAEKIESMRRGEWPSATAGDEMQGLDWTLKRREPGARRPAEKVCEVSFLDFAGEVYRAAYGIAGGDDAQKEQAEALKQYVRGADELIVLINLRDVITNGLGDKRVQEAMWITKSILDTALVGGADAAPRAAIVLSQADSYAETIKACGGARGVLEMYLPHVANEYGWLDVFAANAVDKTTLDGEGREVPAPDFTTQGLLPILRWICGEEVGGYEDPDDGTEASATAEDGEDEIPDSPDEVDAGAIETGSLPSDVEPPSLDDAMVHNAGGERKIVVPRRRPPSSQPPPSEQAGPRFGSAAKGILVAAILAALLGGGYYGWKKHDDVVKAAERARAEERARQETERIAKQKTKEEQLADEKRKIEAESTEVTGPKTGDTKTLTLPGGATMEMIYVAPGSFTMGSPSSEDGRYDSEAQHRVTLTKGYWLGKYEVTQRQWESVMGNNLSRFKGGDRPVENVSWEVCQEFCRKVNDAAIQQFGGGARLPTEAEWEYACRAGSTGPYGGNGNLDDMGWYQGNRRGTTHTVGDKKPNAWGFCDMHGNVVEWCNDWYGRYGGDVTDPIGPASGERRVLRGGGWDINARDCRSAFRYGGSPGRRGYDGGFRLCCSALPIAAVSQFASLSRYEPRGGGAEREGRVVETPPTRSGRRTARAEGADDGAAVAVEVKQGEVKMLTLPGGVKMEMIYVAPGSFTMGSPSFEDGRYDEEVQHRVTLTKGYWLGKYEVTQRQWESVMGNNPSDFKGGDRPVDNVSWKDSQEFCRKVNDAAIRQFGGGARLPTEAEWEYACRAGSTGSYGGSGNLDDMGWYYNNSGTHTVGDKKPNAWGFYDMHGNVWEWCNDWYGRYGGDVTDPIGPASGEGLVLRGGSWCDHARNCRSAVRLRYNPGIRLRHFGFRLCCSVGPRGGGAEREGRVAETPPKRSGRRPARAEGADEGAAEEVKQGDVKLLTLPGGATMEMIYVAPGTFTMGSPSSEDGRSNDEAQHRVTLTKGYWLGKYEVTQRQWEIVMGNNPSRFKGGDRPVENVSWEDCQEFCRKVNDAAIQQFGGGARLPTEAEWEYACRAGSTGSYGGSGNLDEMGWYGGNSGNTTHPVGRKRANDWGFYDMHGNVWEWCNDLYGSYGGDVTDPIGLASGDYRVLRGGGWLDYARYCRSARRDSVSPGSRDFFGFRLSCSALP